MTPVSLAPFPFFNGLDPDVSGKIVRMSTIERYREQDVIFSSGDSSDVFYGLLEGSVALSLVITDRVLRADIEYEEAVEAEMVDKKQCITVTAVEPGQVFGWSAFGREPRRTVTAFCRRPSKVVAMPAAKLTALFEDNPRFGYLFMRRLSDIIARRLQQRTDKLLETWVEAFGASEM